MIRTMLLPAYYCPLVPVFAAYVSLYPLILLCYVGCSALLPYLLPQVPTVLGGMRRSPLNAVNDHGNAWRAISFLT